MSSTTTNPIIIDGTEIRIPRDRSVSITTSSGIRIELQAFDAEKPEAGKQEAGKLEDGKLEDGKPEDGKPEAGKPEAGKPEAGNQEAGNQETGKKPRKKVPFNFRPKAKVQEDRLRIARAIARAGDRGITLLEIRDRLGIPPELSQRASNDLTALRAAGLIGIREGLTSQLSRYYATTRSSQ